MNVKLQNCLCITGPNSIGKSSFLLRKIEEHMGESVGKISANEYKYTNEKMFRFRKSRIHYEMDCKDLGYNDKHVIYNFIEQISLSKTLKKKKTILILKNIHLLTIDGLFSLRGIIDKYEKSVMFLFTSSALQSLPRSILSRVISIPIKVWNPEIKSGGFNNFEISQFKKKNQQIGLGEHPSLMEWARSVISQIFKKRFRTFHNEIIEYRELVYELLTYQIKDYEIVQLIYECSLEYISEEKHRELVELWNITTKRLQDSYRSLFLLELFWLKIQELRNTKKK